MISLTQYIKEGSTQLKWKKEYDGQDSSGRKIYKHVSQNGRYEIALSGMDSMKKNRDGSQKLLPTLFDKTKPGGKIPRHPITSYRNVAAAKKDAQRWEDNHYA